MNVFEDFNLIKFKNNKPPANNSLATFKEINHIDSLHENKSFVKYYDNIPNVFKNLFKEYEYKFPINVVDYLLKNTDSIIIELKNYHNRPRPKEIAKNYNIDLEIVDLPTAKTKSYPSGHSAQAELIGLVLSDMNPSLKTKIMKEANNVSLSRNIGRLHYASDSQNGKHLGQVLYKHYKNKENALHSKKITFN